MFLGLNWELDGCQYQKQRSRKDAYIDGGRVVEVYFWLTRKLWVCQHLKWRSRTRVRLTAQGAGGLSTRRALEEHVFRCWFR